MINGIDPSDWLELNAKLQAKKNVLRKKLKRKGVLKNEQEISEIKVKKLLTDSLLDCELDIKISTDVATSGSSRVVEVELIDAGTGFGETSRIIVESNLTGWKACTEALMQWMAYNLLITFAESREADSDAKASREQVEYLAQLYRGENLKKLLEANHITSLKDLPASKASELISKIVRGGK